MNKYYFDFNYTAANNAGPKAKEDANKIFEKNGYEDILKLPFKSKNVYVDELLTRISSWFVFKLIKKNSIIALNWPPRHQKEQFVFNLLLKNRAKKNLTPIFLVHDLEKLQVGTEVFENGSFRHKCSDEQLIKDNGKIIAHNEKMKDYLVGQGIHEKDIVILGIFDYLAPALGKGGEYGSKMIVAGNLDKNKSSFLNELEKIPTVDFELYGSNLDEEILNLENAHYFGSFSPDEVPAVISGSYGLIWDSATFAGGVGSHGSYQKYNNPHKASLYLAAGFPIVTWKEAALADFILENNLGFVVDNLEELPEQIEAISKEEYTEMKANAQKIGQKIREGYFLTEALKNAENKIEK